MKLKQIISAAAAIIASAAFSITALADSSGFRTEKELALAVKAPYDTKYTNVAWNTSEAESAGVPVASGTSVFLPVGAKVNKLSEDSGEVTASAELTEKVSEDCGGAVLGNTLLQPTRSGLCVINIQTMEIVSYRSFGGTICTDAAIIDNLAYVGVSFDDGCAFYCVDMSDELNTVWEYSCGSTPSSPAVYEDFVLFSAGSTLVSHHYKDDSFNEIDIGAEISGAPFAGEYAVYLSADDGCAYKLRLNSDGSMEEDTLTACEIGGELSSPMAWNGRLYVSSSEGFYILDSLNMDITRSYSDIGYGTEPIVCYGNGSRVYVVAPLESYWCLYSIYDIDDLDEPAVSQLAKLEDFSGGRISVASSGTMYFRDGIGRLYALKVAEYNLLLIIIKLVLLLVLIVLVFVWLRQWVKQRNAKRPPQY